MTTIDPSEIAGLPEPAASFVVYDAGSGEILHIHHFSVMPDAVLPDIETLREIVLQHAPPSADREPSRVDILQVDPREMKPTTTYRVSVEARTLIEEPPAKDQKA